MGTVAITFTFHIHRGYCSGHSHTPYVMVIVADTVILHTSPSIRHGYCSGHSHTPYVMVIVADTVILHTSPSIRHGYCSGHSHTPYVMVTAVVTLTFHTSHSIRHGYCSGHSHTHTSQITTFHVFATKVFSTSVRDTKGWNKLRSFLKQHQRFKQDKIASGATPKTEQECTWRAIRDGLRQDKEGK